MSHEQYDVRDRRGLETDGIIACKGAFSRDGYATNPRGRRRGLRGGPLQGGRSRRARAEPVVRGDPPRGAARLRRSGRPCLGAHGVRDDPRAGLPDCRGRIRHAVPGAKVQPWHRDFPSPPETDEHRLTSLAFNLTTVDTTDEMGPFEIALGTQWDRGDDFDHEQFPAKSEYARYEALGRAEVSAGGRHLCPLRADHPPGHAQPVGGVTAGARARRGRARRRQRRAPRPRRHEGLLGAAPATRSRPPVLPRPRPAAPITQKHDIEGLVMG